MMNIDQTKEFYQMQTEMKNLTKEQAEMRQEIREGFVRNDLKHEEMMEKFTQTIKEITDSFDNKLDKKADKIYETAVKAFIGVIVMSGLGAVGYAIIHAYTQ
jgi:galactokinase/mevalonate kinase-like predicted kinase